VCLQCWQNALRLFVVLFVDRGLFLHGCSCGSAAIEVFGFVVVQWGNVVVSCVW